MSPTVAAGLKVDRGLPGELADVPRAAAESERRGYAGCWTGEIGDDPFLPVLLAAEHTSRPQVGTSVAVAFARNPMTELCGEIADGMHAHAFTTKRYLREVTLPALQRGLDRSGRSRGDVELSAPVFVVTGETEAGMAAAAAAARKQLAFYASTPAYRAVLELHGWGELQPELRALSRSGEWEAMAALIDDEMLGEFAVVAPLSEVADKLWQRCDGVLDRVLPGFSGTLSETAAAGVVDDLRGRSRTPGCTGRSGIGRTGRPDRRLRCTASAAGGGPGATNGTGGDERPCR
jgi:alkanesulfonate monooxygenase SsuD/methylene tetrahydromethanopterin reductase-like flavin-dependent oxidoreductase (luciferase family)